MGNENDPKETKSETKKTIEFPSNTPRFTNLAN